MSAEHDDKHYVADEKSSSSTQKHVEGSIDTGENGDGTNDVEKDGNGDAKVATKTPDESTKQEEVDPNIVDYDGPDDPTNPYNWTKARKWINGGFLSALTFITYVSLSCQALPC
jgi:hypothetical protein